MPVFLHIHEFCHKRALLVAIGVETLATIEHADVSLFHILVTIVGESVENVVQQSLLVCLVPMNLPKRYRIGSIALELSLVDIDANADNRLSDGLSCQPMLYQDATYLGIPPINVVGPLDAHIANLLAQGICYCQGYR